MTDLRNTVLIDSNVLLDVITNDPLWADWSMESILRLGRIGQLAINPIIRYRSYFPEVKLVCPA